MWTILTSTILLEHFNEIYRLLLSQGLELFEPGEGLWFVLKEINPYFPAKIINKCHKIKATSYGLGLHDEADIFSLHTINITRTPGIFDKPLIGQIYIDN